MSEKNTGRVTIPTNLDVVPETIELMNAGVRMQSATVTEQNSRKS